MLKRIAIFTVLIYAFVITCIYWGDNKNDFSVAADDFAEETTPIIEEEKEEDTLPSFYNEANSERYEHYSSIMPGIDFEDVIWHVNAGLDNVPYTLMTENSGDNPLLVNKRFCLPEGYEPPELIEIRDGITATPGTVAAFKQMRIAAKSSGIDIDAMSGYRSIERQAVLFINEETLLGTVAAEEAVARPGSSEHNTGRALDIMGSNFSFDNFDETDEYKWLLENCADYGFIIRYPNDMSVITGFSYEPWHFTFVGKSIALGMKEHNIPTLEEYVARALAPLNGLPFDDRIVVVIDPGHGGNDSGAEASLDGIDIYEKDLNLDIALLIKPRLEEENIRVILTRDSDEYVSLETRCEIANAANASLFISIHQNIDETKTASGIQSWIASNREESLKLAEAVHGRLLLGLKSNDRGVHEDDEFVVTRMTEMPSVIIETGFLSDTDELKLLTTPDYRERIASSVSNGIVAYLGIRTMYLTFDDGPSEKNTAVVLDILKERNIKATFFVVGENALTNPDLLKRIAAEGHAVGIHCYSHDYKKLYASADSFVEDFNKAREAVKTITGLEPVIYRFPGGSINDFNKQTYAQIIEKMNELGFIYFDWNICAGDSKLDITHGELLNNVKNEPRYRNAILLMHDAYSVIGRELNDILDYYSDYQMEIITAGTKPVQL